MPQLNPAPWLLILVFSWFVFTTIIPPKVASHKTPNDPNPQSTKTLKMTPWTWQWH
uniref:ATP synthase F0 subunit 8 n=1 Tax=Syngnathus californiensis TaxID=320413 RepID=UPI0020280C89|nr:ATP synthase F0 subunit 8 [Syngnathus californiensis]YP_010393279.1 ATP synthase F0 subunit 8 [Syngnathus euchrous]YP_010393305.1 ATP synthase F0 subunit 8 [Syngnathus leptorhynchus]YP_010393318.1 ATP synthase F0 subunit 8 [Syngnathus exilis]UPX89441.1 ATP synthase F0 subunit 8 [Syngnathus californiensis]UPX89454.1 ATP synthase F0 subunit 8 [Syngnathus euchrous]UPX89480.1 ATP synthase F0 subunit 8 [Syngnathus leptorhynchus]UPX89493.1 ATP synthase F0 subunit 8 [Syngnathus exilis]